MKYLYAFLLFTSSYSFGQNYNLLPDTCTTCSYIYTMGTAQQYEGAYDLNPDVTVTYLGNTYIKLSGINTFNGGSVVGFRQVGDKVLGIEQDSTQEHVFQDWEAPIGDTLFNLFSNGKFYDAVVTAEDSMMLNDGSYHHIRGLLGIGYYDSNNDFYAESWDINWHERGLCAGGGLPNATDSLGYGAGGIQYNFPDHLYFCLCSVYAGPKSHTSDTRYNLGALMDSCTYLGTASLDELTTQTINVYPNPTKSSFSFDYSGDVKLIQVLDMRGSVLKEFNTFQQSIDLNGLSEGTYLLQIESSKGARHQARIVKTD